MDIFIIIIAGGIGTRFWPLSRRKKPKQFLPIISEKSMIEETVNRLLPYFPASKIFTVANAEQTQTIKKLLPILPEEKLIIEPQAKNTAPSLMLATATIFLKNPNAAVIALPADHLIKNIPLFIKKLKAGAVAAIDQKKLVTFGIPPTYPATGYGYIQFSLENPFKILDEKIFLVKKFKEKPDLKNAQEFLKAGNFYWNSGMFIWQAEVFAKMLDKHAPAMYLYWEKILNALKNRNEAEIASIFEEIPFISIDFALMEKAKGVLMCEGNFGWSDVGSWSSLADIWKKDKKGNTLRGECIILDSKNNIVYSPHKLTAVAGVKDIIIVNTEDALLICHKRKDQKVKDIVEQIKKKGRKEYL